MPSTLAGECLVDRLEHVAHHEVFGELLKVVLAALAAAALRVVARRNEHLHRLLVRRELHLDRTLGCLLAGFANRGGYDSERDARRCEGAIAGRRLLLIENIGFMTVFDQEA